MKVVLLEDVKTLGKAGDLVEVRPGYANNFLIRQGLAARADKQNMNVVRTRQEAARARARKLLETAQETGKKLQGKVVTLKVKTGEAGRLYGTITNQDIADQLASQEIQVDKRDIVLDEAIKAVGEYAATVRLHPEVSVPFVVQIVADAEA